MIQRIKRVAMMAVTMTLLVVAVMASASAVQIKMTSDAAVRYRPRTSSAKVASISEGTTRTALKLSSNGNWVKIKINGKTGYVHKARLTCTSGSLSSLPVAGSDKVCLGQFKLTFYGGDTMTASGKTPRVNHTIAVDPRVIPLGSKVYIEGFGTYYAEDTGGAIKNNIIDIFVTSEAEANRIGVRYANVYLYK